MPPAIASIPCLPLSRRRRRFPFHPTVGMVKKEGAERRSARKNYVQNEGRKATADDATCNEIAAPDKTRSKGGRGRDAMALWGGGQSESSITSTSWLPTRLIAVGSLWKEILLF